MIEIGQDALGRWAWMIRDEAGSVIASADDYYEAQLAMEAALARRRELDQGHEA